MSRCISGNIRGDEVEKEMTTFTSEDRENSMPQLIKYRDAGMATYTYFWTINKKVVSPYFDSEQQAKEWKYEDKSTTGN